MDENIPCHICPKICHSDGEWARHLKDHGLSDSEISKLRGKRGYFEPGTETPEGTVAIKHRDAARLAQMESEKPLNVPMVAPKEHRTVSPPAGWMKTLEGYAFNKLISQTKTIDSIVKKVVQGNIISNHATLFLVTFNRDIGELSKLEDTERILESKIGLGVSSDNEYLKSIPIVTEKLLQVREKIRSLKEESTDTEKETLLEAWFSGDLNSTEHIEWQEKFMQDALLEVEQTMKQAPKQEIKL